MLFGKENKSGCSQGTFALTVYSSTYSNCTPYFHPYWCPLGILVNSDRISYLCLFFFLLRGNYEKRLVVWKMDFGMMLQRQVEVSGTLRTPPTTPDELGHTRLIIKALSTFITQISRTSTKLQLPLEMVFQCLMQMGLGSMDGVSFDKQHRQGNVPMHQAKVLDRNQVLNSQQVEPRLREIVEPELLEKHIEHCTVLRNLLRMKVEDGNDLSMARKAVSLAEEYLDAIYKMADGNLDHMIRLYRAEDEQAIRKILGHSGDDDAAISHLAAGRVVPTKHLPNNIIRGIADECSGKLESLKAPFADRQQALQNILSWLQAIDQQPFNDLFANLLAALHVPLKEQLGDKRSQVCRLACDIVSTVVIRSIPSHFTPSKSKEILLSWLGVILKGIHVTVAAIADGTDAVARDIVLSTHGAAFVVNFLLQAFAKSTQSEMKRKVLNYIVLAVLVSKQSSGGTTVPMDYHLVAAVALKACAASEDACRRVGRILLVVLERVANLPVAQLDAKIEKTIAQEREAVLEAISQSVEYFEVALLKYAQPSKASAFVEEKSSLVGVGSNPNSPSKAEQQKQRDEAAPGKAAEATSAPRSTAALATSTAEVKPPVQDVKPATRPVQSVAAEAEPPVKPWKKSTGKSTPTTGSSQREAPVDVLVKDDPPQAPGVPKRRNLPSKASSAVTNDEVLVPSARQNSLGDADAPKKRAVTKPSGVPPPAVASTGRKSPSLALAGSTKAHAQGEPRKEKSLSQGSTTSSNHDDVCALPDITNNNSFGGSSYSTHSTLPALPLSLKNLAVTQSNSQSGFNSSVKSEGGAAGTNLSGSLKKRLSSRAATEVFE